MWQNSRWRVCSAADSKEPTSDFNSNEEISVVTSLASATRGCKRL